MDALIVYPENNDQLEAVKAVMKAMKIVFEEKNLYPNEVLQGVNASMKQVNEGEIHPYTNLSDMLDK